MARVLASVAVAMTCAARPSDDAFHVLSSSNPSAGMRLAASQLRRFVYDLELSNAMPVLAEVDGDPAACGLLADPRVGVKLLTLEEGRACAMTEECLPSGTKDAYAVCRSGRSSIVVGNGALGVLYGVHAFVEAHGVRFSMEGPLLPAPALARERAQRPLHVKAEPAFTQRGLQPFHDFFSGPDWWSEDKYKAVSEALLGMKANQLALHTYPYSTANAASSTGANEPTVWVGTKENVNPDGTVSSAYPVSWANTHRSEWAMTSMNTSDALYTGVGAQAMFECDCFGHPLQSCDPSLCPATTDNATSVALFNAVGEMWRSVFPYAHALGVGTTLGTEMPLSMPADPQAMAGLNVYYSASRNDHFVTTSGGPGQDCAECEGLYTYVSTIGFLYQASNAGVGATLQLNTYYDGTASDNVLAAAPPGPTYTFVRTEGYAAPASSSGTADTPLLQYLLTKPKTDHWALAGAAMQAQAVAEGYAPLGGSIAAIWSIPDEPVPGVYEFYEGILTRLTRLVGPSCVDNTTGASNGMCTYWVWTPEWFEWSQVNISNPLIQNVVNDTLALHAARDALAAPFNLATCGWVVGPLGARWYMDTILAPDWTVSSIDMNVGNTPVDPAYANITHHDKWVIPWAEDDPGLTAPELWLNRTLSHARDAQAYGADGLLIIHWRTRVIDPQVSTGLAYAWNTSLTTTDAWAAWAQAQFGPSAAPQAAAIFLSIDSFDTPRPVAWIGGPGGVSAAAAQCKWQGTYAFVDAFFSLRAAVVSDISGGLADAWALERFDYWAKSLAYMRGIARFECDWAAYDAAISSIQKISDPTQRQAAAVTLGYAARSSLIANASRLLWDQLAEVTTPGEMGIFSNLVSHSLYQAIGAGPTGVLAGLAGVTSLPAALMLPGTFDPAQPPLLRVPVRRTMLGQGEPFRVRAFLLATPANLPPVNVTLFTAPLGTARGWGGGDGVFTPTPMTHLTDGAERFVYTAELPSFAADFEWYIAATLPSTGSEAWRTALPSAGLVTGAGTVTLNYPPTAPATPQTVVVVAL